MPSSTNHLMKQKSGKSEEKVGNDEQRGDKQIYEVYDTDISDKFVLNEAGGNVHNVLEGIKSLYIVEDAKEEKKA